MLRRLASAMRIAAELCRVTWRLGQAERWRTQMGPRPALEAARARGRRSAKRDPNGRERLRRVIRAVERRRFREANCYRQVLLEVALDAGAAATPVCLGLPSSADVTANEAAFGHAWLADDPRGPSEYEVRYPAVVRL